MRYQEKLQQWLIEGEPDIITYMDISTAHEIILRLKNFHPDAYDDDYIGTLAKILEEEIEAYYNPPDPNAPQADF